MTLNDLEPPKGAF